MATIASKPSSAGQRLALVELDAVQVGAAGHHDVLEGAGRLAGDVLEHEDAHAAQRTGPRAARGACPDRAVAASRSLAALAAAAARRRAGAHAVLLSSEPASGAVLQTQPTEVAAALQRGGGDRRRRDGRGRGRRPAGSTAARSSCWTAAAPCGRRSKGTLAEGSYSVAWRVTSADAHVIQGSVRVLRRPARADLRRRLIDDDAARRRSSSRASAARSSSPACWSSIGIAAFLLAVWLPLARSAQERLGPRWIRRPPPSTASRRRRAGRRRRAAGRRADRHPGAGLADRRLARRRARHALRRGRAVRLVLAPHRHRAGGARGAQPLADLRRGGARRAAPAGLPAGLVGPRVDRRARLGPRSCSTASTCSRPASGAAGWRCSRSRSAPASARLDPEPRRPFLRGAVHRFTRLAVGAVAVLVVTGTIAGLRELDAVSELVDTRYGQVLALKVLVVAAALRRRAAQPPRRARASCATCAARRRCWGW